MNKEEYNLVSKKIQGFLLSHPLINYNGIAVQLGLANGQLRSDRSIPKKYVLDVEKILMGYGYVRVVDSVNEMVVMPEKVAVKEVENGADFMVMTKTHEVKNGVIGKTNDKGWFFKEVLEDGDYFVKKL